MWANSGHSTLCDETIYLGLLLYIITLIKEKIEGSPPLCVGAVCGGGGREWKGIQLTIECDASLEFPVCSLHMGGGGGLVDKLFKANWPLEKA